eukprot:TRINITY_DN931_c0_g1_i2.p2 TRINITY_DN931_c0_g1~~TRINITY_DN931_c0_g1_i2.p2  ORF type:complete len:206 (-),score=20.37 TRINITY_DN931_c0_g1_i2:32-649(-)
MDVTTRMYRIRRTCLQMLRDRGYLVPQDQLVMTREEFHERFVGQGTNVRKEEMVVFVPKQDDPTEQILVFFPDEEKIGVKTIKQQAERMRAENVGRAIMVVPNSLTAFAKTCLAELQPKFIIEHFLESELVVNITEHVLVPKHEVLSLEQKKQLLAKYKIKETQLPRIQLTDPVARYFGLARGEVVRIIRPSETAGRYVTYRVCV